ncbi:hypothetical protein ACFWXB_02850 [Tsukamurella tyrosinosolvens]|uniref:hypothetical protein n=1 Tax=Tsukamurella tyrosinosolvens TaxID=57704 RepID=UPI0036868CAA
MARPNRSARFRSGNERLERMMSDSELRAQVNAILAEQQVIDDRHGSAIETLRGALATLAAATGTAEVTDVLAALQVHLTAAGVREVGITLT